MPSAFTYTDGEYGIIDILHVGVNKITVSVSEHDYEGTFRYSYDYGWGLISSTCQNTKLHRFITHLANDSRLFKNPVGEVSNEFLLEQIIILHNRLDCLEDKG